MRVELFGRRTDPDPLFEGAKLKSGLKKDVNHTGGHLGIKMEVSDLHFDNFDVRRKIVK